MLGDPRSESKVCEPLHRQIGKSGEDRGQIVAQRELQPPTAFQPERIAATFGAACGLPMWIQFFRPRATGRIEFSARLLLNSSSGYSRNRVSFLHGVSAYWQALLSTRGQCNGLCCLDLVTEIIQQSGMYSPPHRHKRKMRVTGWSAPMYTPFVGEQSSWP